MAKKANIVNEMVEMLQKGIGRANILANNGKTWQLSTRTFDRYLADATTVYRETQKAVQTTLSNTIHDEAIEASKRGLKSDLDIELHLQKIAFGELEIEETTASAQFGVTKFKRKPTPAEMTNAIREIWKKRGTYSPEKVEQTITVKTPEDEE